MRLIDADELLKHECEADRMGAMLVIGKGYIFSAPTIESVPIVNGKWVTKTRNIYYPSAAPYEADYCSVCGGRGSLEFAYCPNCGAKMESE